jgi:hypothetical protein
LPKNGNPDLACLQVAEKEGARRAAEAAAEREAAAAEQAALEAATAAAKQQRKQQQQRALQQAKEEVSAPITDAMPCIGGGLEPCTLAESCLLASAATASVAGNHCAGRTKGSATSGNHVPS